MVYATKKAALLTLFEFTPAMRARHKVVKATRDGVTVGWTVVMKGKKDREAASRAPGARFAVEIDE